jgi:hypothetical protein
MFTPHPTALRLSLLSVSSFTFLLRPPVYFLYPKVSLPLLPAVTLAGSAHSPPTEDPLSAPSLYSLTAEFIVQCLHYVVNTRAKVNYAAIETA